MSGLLKFHISRALLSPKMDANNLVNTTAASWFNGAEYIVPENKARSSASVANLMADSL